MREAARVLGISQPAMSQSLKHAEDLLGFELFLRQRGRLVASPELRALMPEVERVFSAVSEIRSRAVGMARGQLGELSIAAIPALTGDWLAHATLIFRRLHPRVALQVVSVQSKAVLERVLGHEADIGLLHGPVATTGLHATTLAENVVVAVLHHQHPLAHRGAISVKDLGNFELISLGHGNAPGDLIASAFREAGVALSVAVEISTSASAITFARAGVGIALIDARTAATFILDDIVVRPLTPKLILEAEAVVAADRPLSAAAASFVSILRQTAQQGGADDTGATSNPQFTRRDS
jgi:DNA-binding transcriptional LysR family regulator